MQRATKKNIGAAGKPVRTQTGALAADFSDRRAQILNIATRLFYQCGFSETSMHDIGREVGLLKGSLYHHFGSKEEMLFEVLRDLHDASLELVEQVAFGTTGPLEQLRVYLEGLVCHAGRDAVRLTIFFRDFRFLAPEQQGRIIEERDIYTHVAERLIGEAQRIGQVDATMDARIMAMTALSACGGVREWYRPDGRQSIETIAADIVAVVIGGMKSFGK